MKQIDTSVLYGKTLQEISVIDKHIVLFRSDKNRYFAVFHINVYERASKVFYQLEDLYKIQNLPISIMSVVYKGPMPSRENPMVEKDEVVLTIEAKSESLSTIPSSEVAVFTFEINRELLILDDRFVNFYEISKEEDTMFKLNAFRRVDVS